MELVGAYGAANVIFLLIFLDLLAFRYKKRITIRHIFYFSFLWGLASIPVSLYMSYTSNIAIDNNTILTAIGGSVSMIFTLFIMDFIIFMIIRYIYRHSQRIRNMFAETEEVKKSKEEPKHKERK